MTQTPPAEISVIVPHYGDPQIPANLLDSLQNQITEQALEVIVVDDASPEPFPDTPGITLVRRSVNGGFGSAVNTGVQAASGEWVLILNSDLSFDADFVERLTTRAARWMPAVVGCRIVGDDGSDQHGARRFPKISHQVFEWLIPLARFRSSLAMQRAVGYDTGPPTSDRRVDWLVGAVLLMPTERFRSAGGFDERFHMNCEETDLQLRLTEQGVGSVQLGSVEVTHQGGASSSNHTNQRRWVVTARRRYADKWGGLRSLQLALTAATVTNLMWNLGRRLLGRPVEPLGIAREEFSLVWSKRYR